MNSNENSSVVNLILILSKCNTLHANFSVAKFHKSVPSNRIIENALGFQDDKDAHAQFVRINRAYEVLKDEELRKKYDLYGEEGLKDDFQGGQQYQSWQFYRDNFGILLWLLVVGRCLTFGDYRLSWLLGKYSFLTSKSDLDFTNFRLNERSLLLMVKYDDGIVLKSEPFSLDIRHELRHFEPVL